MKVKHILTLTLVASFSHSLAAQENTIFINGDAGGIQNQENNYYMVENKYYTVNNRKFQVYQDNSNKYYYKIDGKFVPITNIETNIHDK